MSFSSNADDLLKLREEMINEKPFLKQLFSGSKYENKQILQNARVDQLLLIVQILYFLAIGKIKLENDQFSRLEKKKIKLLYFHETFSSLKKVRCIVKSNNFLPKLLPLASSFPVLLSPLFS